MLALYVFCACLGVPLVALLAFGGGEADGDVDAGFDGDLDAGGFDGDIDADAGADFGGADGGVGDLTALMRRIPISSYFFFMAFFGVGGLIGTAVSFTFVMTLLLAVLAGVGAGFVNTAFFSFLRNTESDSMLADSQLEGRMATVSVPIDVGKRGRVWLDTGDERLQLTAGSVDEITDMSFDRGERVVIVSMDNGVAKVMGVDADLADD